MIKVVLSLPLESFVVDDNNSGSKDTTTLMMEIINHNEIYQGFSVNCGN